MSPSSLVYECARARLKQDVPLSCGHYDFCFKRCPNYPKDTIRTRLTPYMDVQLDTGKGFVQSNERHVKPKRFKRACAVCGTKYAVDRNGMFARKTCGSKECRYALMVSTRLATIAQKKQEAMDISDSEEPELKKCPVCGKSFRPIRKTQTTCLQGLCSYKWSTQSYKIKKRETMKVHELQCEVCGKKFLKYNIQPTCSPHCGQIRRVRRYYANKQEKGGDNVAADKR